MKQAGTLKIAALLSAVSLLTTVFAGCAKNPAELSGVDKTISDETLTYSVFASDLNVLGDSDRVLQSIEEKFNIKLKLEGASAESWLETLSTRINANDPPDLFHFIPNYHLYTDAYYNFVNKSMVLPISDFMSEEETPNLSALLSCEPFSRLSINDKFYFIPAITSPKASVLYVRRDWMENVGITKDPVTVAEYEDMFKRFTENDPDKNGKNDTYGLTMSKVFEWMQALLPTFDITPEWSKVDGKWEYHPFTPNYRNFLEWLSQLYAKGYLKNEFFLYDESESINDFIGGKAGCLIQSWSSAVDIQNSMARTNENAKIDVLAMPNGAGESAAVDAEGNWWGGWSISYKAKEPYRLVKLLDYFHSPDGQMNILCGIEDVHYSVDANGEVQPNLEERAKEPENHFQQATNQELRGFYAFGTRFTYPYTIKDNRVEWTPINSIYANYEFIEKAFNINRQRVVRSFPNSSTELSGEFALNSIAVYEKVETYSVRIVAGLIGLDEGLQAMRDEATDYPAMQAEMEEYTKKIGRTE